MTTDFDAEPQTPLDPGSPDAGAPTPATEVPEPPPPLTAGRALWIFGAYLLTQCVVSIIVMFFGGFGFMMAHGGRPASADLARFLTQTLMMPVAALSIFASAIVVVRMARKSFPGALPESLAPLGWTKAPWRETLLAALVGLGVAVVYCFIVIPAFPPATGLKGGPLARVASAGGSGRHVLAFLAVFIAPPLEEFLFRGILFAGFRRSLGIVASGLLVTALFLLCHVTEIVYYAPAPFLMAGLAVAALAARQLSRSLSPAIALHAGYNFGLFAVIYLSPR